MYSYLCHLFAVFIFTLSGFAFATGFTGEQDRLQELSTGRIPLQVSKDGNWLVHLDGDSILHRTKINDASVDQKVMLFSVPLTISPSRDAQQVAVFDGACVKLVNFGEQANTIRKIKAICAPKEYDSTIQDPGDPHLDTAAIALSNDAKQLAFAHIDSAGQTTEIHIIDAATEELRSAIPAAGTILHLQFLENDTKLLVVQAIMGEVWEGRGGPSDMQFAIWDLKKRELFSFFNSATPTSLDTDDLLWSFSELSGDLASIKPEAEFRVNREKNTPISISRFNLKQCRTQPSVSFVVKGDRLQGDSFYEMVSDLTGRWLATIEANTLIVRSLASGETLHQEKLDNVIRSLSSSADGSVLYGVEAGTLEAIDGTAYYRGGGKVVQFPLGDVLATLPEPKIQNWNDSSCKIENETAIARHIELAAKPAMKLYQIDLGVTTENGVSPFQPYNCYADPDHWVEYQGVDGASSNRWGLSEDGSLWIDRDKELEQLNPLTGKHVRNIPTPRTETLCSIPLFSKQKFFNLVGDKVLAVPFFKAADDALIEFAKLEGSEAKMMVRRGEYVGILWVALAENGGDTPILYNAATGNVAHDFGSSSFEIEGPSFDYSFPVSDLKAGSYRWDLSFMGSVRAQYKSPETSQISTVLWDGFSFGQEKPKQSVYNGHFMNNKIVDLGNGKAVFLKEDGAVFYDAVNKRKLATIPLPGPIDAQWSEKDHVLFVETAPMNPDNAVRQWHLHAYKID